MLDTSTFHADDTENSQDVLDWCEISFEYRGYVLDFGVFYSVRLVLGCAKETLIVEGKG